MSLAIHTYDVGQADSHLLITSNGESVLLDADEDRITECLDVPSIDYFVTTHLHKDHIAGLRHLNDTGCSIDQAFQPRADRYNTDEDGGVKTDVLNGYIDNLSVQDIYPPDIGYLATGDVILEEEDICLTVLSPPATDETIETTSQSSGYPCKLKPEKANPNGAVCKFEGSDGVSGLFMGDVGDESAHNAESWLAEQHANTENDVDLDADILFLGHHGSNKSTGDRFLNTVDPEHVVISSGLDNKYTSENQYDGHPHDETLRRLHDREIDVHWTAVHGTIDTTVEDGTVTLDHDTGLETTKAADIAALKYYGRENDLDQEALVEIEEISLDNLPDETPEWANEASLVTEQAAIDPEKLEELRALETERNDLKREKYRLEETRAQRLERKVALEQETESNKGVTDRLTAAVGSLWGAEDAGDASMQAHTTADHRAEEPATTEEEGHDQSSTDPDTHPSERADSQDSETEQSDDIDATIAAYEQQNAELNAEITELTEQVEGLTAQIETLEAELTNKGLVERARAALGSDVSDTQPTQIRRARFSETAASLADPDTDDTTAPEENAEPTNGKEMAQTQPIDHTPEQTRSSSQHEEQESRTDRSDDRGLSL